jgi:hypothetical protein
MNSIDNKVVSIIYGRGRGFVFTPIIFSSLGDPRVIGTVLIQALHVKAQYAVWRGAFTITLANMINLEFCLPP